MATYSWVDTAFAYKKSGDDLVADVLWDCTVILPGGKTTKVSKGDKLVTDQYGKKVDIVKLPKKEKKDAGKDKES